MSNMDIKWASKYQVELSDRRL